MRLSTIFIFLAIYPASAWCQVSGYVSSTVLSDANPLCNYQELSDQLLQNYLQLEYARAGATCHILMQYAGGLTLFKKFEPRNYLDHTVRIRYMVRPLPPNLSQGISEAVVENPPAELDTTGEDSSHAAAELEQPDSIEEQETPEYDPDTDTLFGAWEFALAAGARHDKAAFRDFDNSGGEFSLGYTFRIFDDLSLRLSNVISMRKYPHVEELSNVTENVLLRLECIPKNPLQWGVQCSAGLKFYIKSSYDTARYEPQQTYTYLPGKGKLGGIIKQPSGKLVLLDASATKSSQTTAQADLRYEMDKVHYTISLRYRYNPISTARRIVQNRSASLLTDDLYNEYFSHEGFEGALQVEGSFFWEIKAALNGEFQQKKYSTPAITLVYDELSDHRTDLFSTIGLQLSKSIAVFQNHDFDISFGVAVVRNQSNDEYNNYTGSHFSFGIGYEF